LGSLILKELLSAGRFKITAITRESSSSILPTDGSISVQKGDYDIPSFLHAALSGQDALILALGGTAIIQPQTKIIEAAAAVGVKWILPTEYGTDSANEQITQSVPFNSMKVAPRLRLEELTRTHEGLKWIGVVTGLWFDYVRHFLSREGRPREIYQANKRLVGPYSWLLQDQLASAHGDAFRWWHWEVQYNDQKHRRLGRDTPT
jgi:hypothetical protein